MSLDYPSGFATAQAALRKKFEALLADDLVCTRVWEAWSYGTMTQDDFEPLTETDRVDELMKAVATYTSEMERKCELYQIKLEAVANRSQTSPHWSPMVGDWYTIDRADLEFFEIVGEDEENFYIESRKGGTKGRSKFAKSDFTTSGFGIHRCKLLPYQVKQLTPTTQSEREDTGD